MYGNGAMTGTVVTRPHPRIILKAPSAVLTVCSAGAVGIIMGGAVVWRIVSTSIPPLATTDAVFALPYKFAKTVQNCKIEE